MRNTSLVILIIILLSIAAFLGGYLFMGASFANIFNASIKNKNAALLRQFHDNADSPMTATATSFPHAISTKSVLSLKIHKDDIAFFDRKTGKLLSFNSRTGKETTISDVARPNLSSAIWAPNRLAAILLYTNSSGTAYQFEDFENNKTMPLASSIRSVAFSADGSQIIYFQKDASTEIGGVYVSQPDGTAAKRIFSTRLKDMRLFWPAEMPFFIAEIENTGEESLFSLSLSGHLEKLTKGQSGFGILWSPKGQRALMSSSSTSSLIVRDFQAKTETVLPISTSPSKCAWSIDEKTLLCGVPTANIPSAPDDLYSVAIGEEAAERLFISGNPNIRVGDIKITSSEGRLIFINSLDSYLYSFPLGLEN